MFHHFSFACVAAKVCSFPSSFRIHQQMYSSLLRLSLRSFAEAAPKATSNTSAAVEDPIKKILLGKLKEYASKKPKDYDAKQLAEALKKKN